VNHEVVARRRKEEDAWAAISKLERETSLHFPRSKKAHDLQNQLKKVGKPREKKKQEAILQYWKN